MSVYFFVVELKLSLPMAETFTSSIKKSLNKAFNNNEGPSVETICTLKLFARIYKPGNSLLEDGWFDEHSLSGEPF